VQELLKKFKSMRTMMGSMGKNLGMLGKIPGMNQLSQMNQLRKMAQNPNLAQMMSGSGKAPSLSPLKRLDKDKLKKVRKAAKQNRKRNRKK
jgi:signal recognition particle subunit SRP54